MADSPRFPVYVDDETFTEDVNHATPAGRRAAERARLRLEREGITPGELYACDPEARDGTRLAGCVKTYLPRPDGPWGIVFHAWERETPGLAYLAFGVRHPQQPWQPSVYQVADRRLHANRS
jgi:hypothetical protein